MATYIVTENCIVAGKAGGETLTDADLQGLLIDQLIESRAISLVDGQSEAL